MTIPFKSILGLPAFLEGTADPGPELTRAAQRVRDALVRYVEGEKRLDLLFFADRLFEDLDLLEAAALAPRTVPEAEARMLEAQEESDAAYQFLRDWSEWGAALVPHPRELTSWDSTRLRERIAGVVNAARNGSARELTRAVEALKEDQP